MAGTFPSRGVWRRPNLRLVDLLVFAALLALLFGLLRLAPALNAPFLPKTAPSTVSTDPANLPYYAVRSLLRMFIALFLSLVFTFVYATAAARLRRAEKVLIPLLDILQSVPVLGFLDGDRHRVHQPVPRLGARPGVRVHLRHLHLDGVEHDVRVLPLADLPAA